MTKRIAELNLVPEAPQSVAAGIIYFVSQSCNLNIDKQDIHQVSEISEVTINKCFKRLEEHKTKLIPTVILISIINNNATIFYSNIICNKIIKYYMVLVLSSGLGKENININNLNYGLWQVKPYGSSCASS